MSRSSSQTNVPRLGPIGCALVSGAWLLAGAATARAQPRMPTHVACVGDSITAGVGASNPANNYPSQLQAMLGSGVIVRNFGHSGATLLTTGDTPYQKTLEYTNANTFVGQAGDGAVIDVIIMLGTNDSKPNNWNGGDAGTRAGQFETDLTALVEHFRGMATQPVVYLALPLDALTNSYTISGPVIHDQIIPIINQVAAAQQVPTIDLNTPTMGQTSYFTDGVHPNDGGYTVVAGVMRDGLMRVPTVTLDIPIEGDMVPAGDVALAASASGGATVPLTHVEFFVGPDSVGSTISPPYTVTWSGAQPGMYALTAVATDNTGAAATSDPVNLTVVAPKTTGGSSGCGCRVAGDNGGAGTLAAVLLGALVVRRRRRSRH
jgi:MYXO-CTERM domain-containing protein